MAELTFYPVAGANSPLDGSIWRSPSSETFSTIRNASSGTDKEVATSPVVLGRLQAHGSTSGRYTNMTRGVILFDTSSLPDNAIISSATLSLYGGTKGISGFSTPTIHICSSSPASTSDLVNGDYSKFGNISFGNIPYSFFLVSAYNDIALNSNGIANINKSGISGFGTRLGWDILNSSPSWGAFSNAVFYGYQADDADINRHPKLTVEYDISLVATGTINFSGSVTPMYPAFRQATGTINFSGSVTALIEVDNEATERKTYMYKIYDLDDNFIGIWDDVISDFNYSQEVNSAGASTYVRLARNSDSLTTTTENLLDSNDETIDDSDDRPIQTTVQSRNQIGPGSTVNHNYRVDVFVFYGELSPILDSNGAPILDSDDNPILGQSGAPNGRRLFTGFISEIESKYGDDETTLVELTSFGFDLDQYVIEDEGLTTVPFNSYDPSDIVSEAMADFNSREGIMNVTAQSVETTGTVVSYTFRVNTYLEVLQKAVELAPSDWFWYADLGQNLIYFRERPSTPSHLFYLGVHLENLKLRSYIGDAVNDVYFSGGEIDNDPVTNLFKRYTQTPATNTRVGLSRLNDNRVILEDSAEILSEGEMDRNNRIQYRSEITILSKVYDIEDISLGDLIGFRNFDNYVDLLTMQIVKIDYTPEKVTLALDTLLPRVSKRLADLKRNMDALENVNNPTAPTV